MPRIDLSRFSPAEKDVLILALLDRVAVLEAKLSQSPKTPGNSVTPAGAKLQWQSKRWRSPFFTFMTARDVPPTNNAAPS